VINDHALRIFTHKELFFAPVERLNDPFDGQLSPGDYVDGLDSGVADILRANEEYVKYVANAKRKGVLSMSIRSDSIPMWAHYADKHRGICLGFSESLGDDFDQYSVDQSELVSMLKTKCTQCAKSKSECLVCNVANEIDELEWDQCSRSWWPVKYLGKSDPHPFSDLCCSIELELNEDPDLAHDFLASIQIQKIEDVVKCDDWEYEKEIRFVAPVSGARKFHSSALKIVIFGVKTSEEDKSKILKLLDKPEWKHVDVVDYKKGKTSISLELGNVLKNGEI
jgi:hypothetical protein